MPRAPRRPGSEFKGAAICNINGEAENLRLVPPKPRQEYHMRSRPSARRAPRGARQRRGGRSPRPNGRLYFRRRPPTRRIPPCPELPTVMASRGAGPVDTAPNDARRPPPTWARGPAATSGVCPPAPLGRPVRAPPCAGIAGGPHERRTE